MHGCSLGHGPSPGITWCRGRAVNAQCHAPQLQCFITGIFSCDWPVRVYVKSLFNRNSAVVVNIYSRLLLFNQPLSCFLLFSLCQQGLCCGCLAAGLSGPYQLSAVPSPRLPSERGTHTLQLQEGFTLTTVSLFLVCRLDSTLLRSFLQLF